MLDPTTSGGGWDVRITRERPLQEVLKGVGEEESATDELAARSVYLVSRLIAFCLSTIWC